MRPRLPSTPYGLPGAAPREHAVTIDFEGTPIRAFSSQPVAVALWAAGVRTFMRSPKYHRPRGPFCFAGHCGSCALRIDGAPGRVSCMTPVVANLRCEREPAFPSNDADLLRVGDWLFPHGLDHHHAMTGTRIGNQLFIKLARQIGGGGALPDRPRVLPAKGTHQAECDLHVDICVVGAGPAGLGAAVTLAERLAITTNASADERANVRVLVIDEGSEPGGSLLSEPGGASRARALAQQARLGGIEFWSGASVLGHYPEDDHPPDSVAARTRARAGRAPNGVLALLREGRVVRVSAGYTLYATGSTDQNLPFGNNDRPGVISARACGRLVFLHGVIPARRITLVESQTRFAYTDRLRTALSALGFRLETLPPEEAARTRPGRGVFAVCTLPAPAFELPRQHGAEVRFSVAAGGFSIVADEDGTTTIPDVRAAGDVTGYVGPEAAYEHGRRAATALVQALGRRA